MNILIQKYFFDDTITVFETAKSNPTYTAKPLTTIKSRKEKRHPQDTLGRIYFLATPNHRI